MTAIDFDSLICPTDSNFILKHKTEKNNKN